MTTDQIFDVTATSLATQISQIAATKPDAIVLWSVGPQIATAFSAIESSSLANTPVLLADGDLNLAILKKTASTLPANTYAPGAYYLVAQSGGMGERDPYLDRLAHMTLEADTLEEKVFLMQVFYERLIIPRFRLIARSSRGTVLEDLCNRLAIDDGIHHGAGMAYERVLLATAGDKTKNLLIEAANRMLPLFVQHALWRPKAREFVGQLMHDTDVRRLHEDVENGVRLARSLGLDVSDIQLPV